MQIFVQGQNKEYNLRNEDFITEGGEGKIYVSGDHAFKIYLDPDKVISLSKIQELSSIKNENVIRPQALVLNKKNKPVGYIMKYVSNTYNLCQLFPKIFRDRERLDNDMVLKLIQQMQKVIKDDVHKSGNLIVDYNEVNFLSSKDFKVVYFIDVDSYETKSFPATAISPSVRDWTTDTFTTLTDWFSFGIISFQLFVGIHPFRGRYDRIRYPQDKQREMKERLLERIPVFHKDVTFPSACLPFETIPQAYRDWYKALFCDGKRVLPPSDTVEVIIVPVITKKVAGDKDILIDVVYDFQDEVVNFVSENGIRLTVTKNDIFQENNFYGKVIGNKTPNIAVTPRTNKIITSNIDGDHICFYNLSNRSPIDYKMRAEKAMSFEGRIYFKNDNSIFEMNFLEIGGKIVPSSKIVASVMPKGTQLFQGVAIQNMLGKYVLSLFPNSGSHIQIPCPEIEKFQIIDAKYDSMVLMVIGSQQGKITKFVFKFEKDFTSYSLRKVENISYCGINFCVLENGITVHINEEEELEVFSNKKDSLSLKVIDSNAVSGDMKLFSDGSRVLFSKRNKVYSIKMK